MFRHTIGPQILYMIAIASRVFVMALLLAYLRFWAALPLILFLLVNFFLTRILRTNMGKNLFTTCASIIAPVCFASRFDIMNLSNPHRKFNCFYVCNSVLFLCVSILSMGLLDFALMEEHVGGNYGCDYTPFLSCLPSDNGTTTCQSDRLAICSPENDDSPHHNFLDIGNALICSLSVLQLIVAAIQTKCLKATNKKITNPI